MLNILVIGGFTLTPKYTPFVFFLLNLRSGSRYCDSILHLIFLRIFVKMDNIMLNLGMNLTIFKKEKIEKF